MDSEEEESEPAKNLIFETDDFENAMVNAVWYGQKVPTKRKLNTRGRNPNSGNDVDSFFEDKITLAACQEYLLGIESFYTE